MAAEGKGSRGLSRAHIVWAVLAGVLAGHVILAALVFDPKPFVGGDNASYMILAESLEGGQGYRDLYLPDAPRHRMDRRSFMTRGLLAKPPGSTT